MRSHFDSEIWQRFERFEAEQIGSEDRLFRNDNDFGFKDHFLGSFKATVSFNESENVRNHEIWFEKRKNLDQNSVELNFWPLTNEEYEICIEIEWLELKLGRIFYCGFSNLNNWILSETVLI